MIYERLLTFSIISLSCLSITLVASQSLAGSYEKYEGTRREALNMTFAFYGKVIDIEGNPVPDAQVILTKYYIPILPLMGEQKEVRRKTDDQGRFFVEDDGFQIELERIEKAGYEYHFKYNPKRGFRFYKNEKKAELGQLPDQPIVFKIRKQGIPTLVLGANATFGLVPRGKPAFLDLLWQEWASTDDLRSVSRQHKGWQPDLKIYLEGDRKNCQLVIETIDADTGIVEDQRELFEAPQSGYKPKLVISLVGFEEGKGFGTYVYVKGRGGQFYTRLDIGISVENRDDFDKRFARLNINYRTNPNGGRSLEEDKELGAQYNEDVYTTHKRRPYGYDQNAKGLSIEDVQKLLGK